MRLATEAEWIFWNEGEAISERPAVRRVVPVRNAERSSLRPSGETWSATWAPRGPQRGPGASPDARPGGVPLETVLGTEFDTLDLAPRATAAGRADARESSGDRHAGAGAAGAGDAPPAVQVMHDSEESDFSGGDSSDEGESLLQLQARVIGEELELAAALEPVSDS